MVESNPGSPSLPKLVIDARMVEAVPHGFSRYVTAIAQGLREVEAERPLAYLPIFLVSSRFRQIPRQPLQGFATCEAGARFLSPLELIELPRMLKRLGAGAYHSPTFSSLIGAPCPWVLTVHDLNHLKYGGKSKRLYYERLLKPFARKAAALVTVSEFSRAELAGWVGLPPARIEIVSNVIAPQEKVPEAAVAEAVNAAGTKRGRYFLTLSNPKPHKNLGTLVAAYRAYRAAVPGGWDLLLSVRPGEVPGTECEGIRCIGGVADVSARALLAGAGTVAFPSSYEGFGLPPVEAAAQGIPVVVSRIAPHREGLQDLLQGEALWVEPMDVAAWTSALTRASSGKGELLAPSIESRAAILRRYSARQMGERMDLIYRRVLGIST